MVEQLVYLNEDYEEYKNEYESNSLPIHTLLELTGETLGKLSTLNN